MENLPDDCIIFITRYLSYDEISKLRLVNTTMNRICSERLNHGFCEARLVHAKYTKQLKNSLPKRESERCKHHLNPRHTILQAIETRLSLLIMTYNRWIGDGVTCFIPGKVLDELFRLLREIKGEQFTLQHYPNSVAFLREFRDLSSMAMEHFDEHIMPDLETKNSSKRSGHFKNRWESKTFLGGSRYSERIMKHNDSETITGLNKKVTQQGHMLEILSTKLVAKGKRINSLQSTVAEQGHMILELSKQMNALQNFVGLHESSRKDQSKPCTSSDSVDNNCRTEIEQRNGIKRTSSTDDSNIELKKMKVSEE